MRTWTRPNLEKPKSYSQSILYCLELGMTRALYEHTNLNEDQIEEVLQRSALYYIQEMGKLVPHKPNLKSV